MNHEKMFTPIVATMKLETNIALSNSFGRIKTKVDDIWGDIRRDIKPKMSKRKRSGGFELQVIGLAEKVHQLKGYHKGIVEAAKKVELELANKKYESE
jgi:hypothetical protein